MMRSVDEVIEIVKNTKYPFTPRYIAMDSDGDWFAYEHMPVADGDMWSCSGGMTSAVIINIDDSRYDCWETTRINIEYLFEEDIVKRESVIGSTISNIENIIEGFEVDIIGNNNKVADLVLKVSALNEEIKNIERSNNAISRRVENLKHTVNILSAVRDGRIE